MKNTQFEKTLLAAQLRAWNAIKAVITNVLGGKRAFPEVMKQCVNDMKTTMKKLKSSITTKMHMLYNHLDDFIQQSPKDSDEHGEHVHQIIMPIEKRFMGKKIVAMLAEICWWGQKMRWPENEEEGDVRVVEEGDVHVVDEDESEADESDYPDESDESDESSESEASVLDDLDLSDDENESGQSDEENEPQSKKLKSGPSTSGRSMEID